MSDLGWRAEGIERALAAGGRVLEVYRRPGFAGGTAVRDVTNSDGSRAEGIRLDPDPPQDDDE